MLHRRFGMRLRSVCFNNVLLAKLTAGGQVLLSTMLRGEYDHVCVPLTPRAHRGGFGHKIHATGRSRGGKRREWVLRIVHPDALTAWVRKLSEHIARVRNDIAQPVDLRHLADEGFVFVGPDRPRIEELLAGVLDQSEVRFSAEALRSLDAYQVELTLDDVAALERQTVEWEAEWVRRGARSADPAEGTLIIGARNPNTGDCLTLSYSSLPWFDQPPGWRALNTRAMRRMMRAHAHPAAIKAAEAFDLLSRPDWAANIRRLLK